MFYETSYTKNIPLLRLAYTSLLILGIYIIYCHIWGVLHIQRASLWYLVKAASVVFSILFRFFPTDWRKICISYESLIMPFAFQIFSCKMIIVQVKGLVLKYVIILYIKCDALFNSIKQYLYTQMDCGYKIILKQLGGGYIWVFFRF